MTTNQRRRCRARVQRPCAVQGCFALAQNIGRFCQAHDKRNEETGHPLGRTIRKAELRPHVRTTRAFIARHRDHPGIVSACAWLEKLVGEAMTSRPPLRTSTPAVIRAQPWLATLRGYAVSPEDMLAVIAAVWLMRELDPRPFKDDRHFRHQMVNRFVRIPGGRYMPQYRGGTGGLKIDRLTVGVREYLSERLTKALGLLCLNIARTIVAEMAPPNDHLEGVREPFPTSTPSTHEQQEQQR